MGGAGGALAPVELSDKISYAVFKAHFQICQRCTAKKLSGKAQSGLLPALERLSPVVLRTMPTVFEGKKVHTCKHYKWVWCPGIPGKCCGSNRHKKCPKYLARSTFWKHGNIKNMEAPVLFAGAEAEKLPLPPTTAADGDGDGGDSWAPAPADATTASPDATAPCV